MDPFVVTAVGWTASAFLVGAFWCREDRALSLVLAAGLALMAVHLGASGAWTAASGCACGAARSLAALRWPGSVRLALASCAAGAALAVPTWDGLPSALALLAGTATSLALVLLRGRAMRLAMLPVSCVWTAHHLLVGSVPALATELLAAAGNATAAWRTRGSARKDYSRIS